MAESTSKLLALSDPLFEYVCRLNRSVRNGVHIDARSLRADLRIIFDQMDTGAGIDPGLMHQFEKVRLPLTFFADSMVKQISNTVAQDWKNLAHDLDPPELAGEEKFFDLLEDQLNTARNEDSEVLAVYYTCLGLGFQGVFSDQPEYIHRKMEQCAANMRNIMDADFQSRFVPESELSVNTMNLVETPARSVIGIVIALIGLIVVLLIGNVYLYNQGVKEISNSLEKIEGGSTVVEDE